MEKLTLTPKELEIVVGSGCVDGAVDLFSYGAEEHAARALGSLYIVGWRQVDTNTMGYMVSLIAALARREYYTNVEAEPKEAFTRTLRKINEVVEEFFKSEGAQLSVGVFAIAGGTVMVSKLGKFKILLARDGQVIDILNNVALFSKEHVQKRQFSSIISGSIQHGDRLLAYYPAKTIVARERTFKPWLLNESGPTIAARLSELETAHPGLSASFLHVDMVQAPETVEATLAPKPEPKIEPEPEAPQPPIPAQPTAQMAWMPRQAPSDSPTSETAPMAATAVEPEQEVPHIIPTEFSLGVRRNALRERFGRLRLVRLDGRGKAIMLGITAAVVISISLLAKSLWFVSPAEQHLQDVVATAQQDLETAREDRNPVSARALLAQTIATLQTTDKALADRHARELVADAIALMDELDGAHTASLAVLVQLDPDVDRILLATWSSESDSLWAVTTDRESALSVVRFDAGGSIARRVSLTNGQPDLLLGWNDGTLTIDFQTRTVLRIQGNEAKPYVIPMQEPILDAAVYDGNLYILTSTSILRVTDLTTTRPVTRPWLADDAVLPAGASRLVVDGSIHVFGKGTLTTYYKGEAEKTVDTALDPSGSWRLVSANSGRLAATVPERMRIYLFSLQDGALTGTLKVGSQQPLVSMDAGPDGSFIVVTQDNRIWEAR